AGLAEFAGLDHPAREGPTEMIRRQIRRVFPGLTWESEQAWLGQRPSTPDSLPLVGPSPKERHIVFAFGAQHLGITMGPKLGQIAAGLVQDRPLNLDMAPYRVDRFD
ncbi:MAG: FAD-binding oxidoreductase, partial [Pseudomonadota bacterium]